MSDRTYFVAAGRSLECVREWQEAEQAAHEKAWALAQSLGAKGIKRYASPYRIAGFVFEGTRCPKGFKRTKHDVCWPTRTTEAGKALNREIEKIHGKSFNSMLGAKDLMMIGYSILSCGMEKFGDVIVVSVPHDENNEPFFIPEDAVLLKMSEYWAMKEAASEA